MPGKISVMFPERSAALLRHDGETVGEKGGGIFELRSVAALARRCADDFGEGRRLRGQWICPTLGEIVTRPSFS